MPSSRVSPSSRRGRTGTVVAVGLLGLAWLGVTSTSTADAESVRPGDSVSVMAAARTLPATAPARAIPRLEATTAALPSAHAARLHTALTKAAGWLRPTPPEADAADDARSVEGLGTPTGEAGRRATVDAATSTLELAGTLTTAALTAPPEQARRLLASAAALDDAAAATLRGLDTSVPRDSGVAAALRRAGAPTSIPEATEGDGLVQDLRAAQVGSTCTTTEGDDAPASQGTTTSGGGDAADETTDARSGLAGFPVESARLAAARATTVQTAGEDLGRLAYATRVVAQRAGSAALATRADELDALVRQVQDARPEGCASLVTTTAGATKVLVSGGVDALVEARSALADRWRDAAAAVEGDARTELAGLWWAEHSR